MNTTAREERAQERRRSQHAAFIIQDFLLTLSRVWCWLGGSACSPLCLYVDTARSKVSCCLRPSPPPRQSHLLVVIIHMQSSSSSRHSHRRARLSSCTQTPALLLSVAVSSSLLNACYRLLIRALMMVRTAPAPLPLFFYLGHHRLTCPPRSLPLVIDTPACQSSTSRSQRQV